MTTLTEVYKITWPIEDLNRRLGRNRWTRHHATLDSEEEIDQERGVTLCGRRIPWEAVRTGLHFRLTNSQDVDCGGCLKSIERLRAAGEW